MDSPRPAPQEAPPRQDVDEAGAEIEPKDKGHRIADGCAGLGAAEQGLRPGEERHGTERYCHYCQPMHNEAFVHGACSCEFGC